MSKSKGNVVDPFHSLSYGVDAFATLAREVILSRCQFTPEQFVEE